MSEVGEEGIVAVVGFDLGTGITVLDHTGNHTAR